KRQMIRNATLGDVQVDPETYKVTFDGQLMQIEPASRLPLNRLFFL
ncbi:MAG: amidohydrolase, partial [Nonomuraea sp.]|nr:amidohydrolase [Nonomuraea sp.]